MATYLGDNALAWPLSEGPPSPKGALPSSACPANARLGQFMQIATHDKRPYSLCCSDH